MLSFDPLRLDRTLSRFAAQRARFAAALRTGPALEHSFELLPSGLDEERLAALDDARDRDPLAKPLREWLAALLLEHSLIEERRALASALRLERHRIDDPERAELTLGDIRRAALADAERREAWLHAYETRTAVLEQAYFRFCEHRGERAQELAVALDRDAATHRKLIAAVLEQTRDALGELGIDTLAAFIEQGLGVDLPGAYPKRLSPRAIADLFREGGWLQGLEPQPPELPEMVAPASLARALDRFGAAFHDAGANRSRPFVLAYDVLGLRRAEFSALLGLLPLTATFALRRLELSRSRLVDHQRASQRVTLLALRAAAIRAELSLAACSGADSYRRCFREWLPSALGFELNPNLAGALFVEDAAPRRLHGLLSAIERAQALVERYDEDWFRNPRAIEALRAELDETPKSDLDEGRALRGLELFVKTQR